MSVLIDTSVWSDHFRRRNEILVSLIELDQALTHPMVVGELACGTPPEPRATTLSDIDLLQAANQAGLSEVRAFIEQAPGLRLVLAVHSSPLFTKTGIEGARLPFLYGPVTSAYAAKGSGA